MKGGFSAVSKVELQLTPDALEGLKKAHLDSGFCCWQVQEMEKHSPWTMLYLFSLFCCDKGNLNFKKLRWFNYLLIVSTVQPIFMKSLESTRFLAYRLVYRGSVQFSLSVMSDSLWPHEQQQARPFCLSPTPGLYPTPCPLSRWCHPPISSSVLPFSSCLQSFPGSESFPMSQIFTSGGQSIRVSASTSVLPKTTQDWSPLGWTGWISLQSKGLSGVFSNTTVQKHQFFSTQLSL